MLDARDVGVVGAGVCLPVNRGVDGYWDDDARLGLGGGGEATRRVLGCGVLGCGVGCLFGEGLGSTEMLTTAGTGISARNTDMTGAATVICRLGPEGGGVGRIGSGSDLAGLGGTISGLGHLCTCCGLSSGTA